jgi:hypothetical protein
VQSHRVVRHQEYSTAQALYVTSRGCTILAA